MITDYNTEGGYRPLYHSSIIIFSQAKAFEEMMGTRSGTSGDN